MLCKGYRNRLAGIIHSPIGRCRPAGMGSTVSFPRRDLILAGYRGDLWNDDDGSRRYAYACACQSGKSEIGRSACIVLMVKNCQVNSLYSLTLSLPLFLALIYLFWGKHLRNFVLPSLFVFARHDRPPVTTAKTIQLPILQVRKTKMFSPLNSSPSMYI